MILFGAGIAVISALLIASYSGRGMWLACCSTAMSMVVFIGCVFLPAIDNPRHLRVGLTWLATQLSLVLDERALVELTRAISWCGEACMTASREEPPILPGAEPPIAGSTHEAGQTMQAASIASWLAPIGKPKDASRSVVSWLLDEPNDRVSYPGIAAGYLIRGINLSDQTLRDVRATLKPDSSQSEVALEVKGQGDEFGSATVIPPEAKFALRLHIASTHAAIQSGGAILKFTYVYAGRQRAVILYLTPSTIARLAERG